MSKDKTPHICETCGCCVYVGEGDFICDYSQDGKGSYFYIPNRRDNFMDSKSVLAWAEIPPLEVK